ncbi:MAG: TRAP transporter small permease subunit [Spirochaetaceae bacterium]|jgi:TRAP-type C4-dicarboxylate transport system permease small subunit|nr:TRAP transporter small permease subunit [Spirochaetaceae bacterium]
MKKIYNAWCKIEIAVCGAGFVFLVLFVFLSAILRFFRISMSWIIDMALFLLSWTAFLGADIAWRSGQLVGIDIVTRKLSKRMQKFIALIIYIVVFFALGVFIVYGINLAWQERVRTYQSIPIPYSLVTLSMIVASASMCISTAIKFYDGIINFNKEA